MILNEICPRILERMSMMECAKFLHAYSLIQLCCDIYSEKYNKSLKAIAERLLSAKLQGLLYVIGICEGKVPADLAALCATILPLPSYVKAETAA